jgi:hypothetical protein
MGKKNKIRAKSGATRGGRNAKAKSATTRGSGAKAAAAADSRRTGLRGAAPWAARHAAKHAAEARARNAQPPPPGSARATLRTPEQAEQIKAVVGELHNALVKIRALRKSLNDKFYELGQVLATIKDRQLYEAKGYSSFEAFVEREIDLGKTTSLRLERVPHVFNADAAREIGLEGLLAALDAIDSASQKTAHTPTPRGSNPAQLPLKPPTGRR